ncbi:MAG: hypothetical protein KJO11_04360 [Gemmatimonadetes bacterium]|nr:hypothetical protein [Gemmatimonadota bacterium]NNK64681.1 hypothetical protein [Gemmatimonadota bacterium]
MHPLPVYLNTCISRGLLEPSPISGVYWSTSIPRKLADAKRRHMSSVTLGLGDFLVAGYTTLANAKKGVHAWVPGSWAGTEIHHIVENFHLQFLGVVETINEQTYRQNEPCVLMAKKHHDTHVDNIVGGAQDLVMETRDLDFVSAFRAAHPGISQKSRTEQAALRAAWVKQQEGRSPPPVTREQIKDALLEIYGFAYQGPELAPLRLIATSVIRGMPL